MPCSPISFSPGYLYTVMYRILKSWLKSSSFFYKAPSQVKLKSDVDKIQQNCTTLIVTGKRCVVSCFHDLFSTENRYIYKNRVEWGCIMILNYKRKNFHCKCDKMGGGPLVFMNITGTSF